MNKSWKFLVPMLLVLTPVSASAGLFDDLTSITKKIKGDSDGGGSGSSSGSSTSNDADAIATSNSTINFICYVRPSKSIYAKLGKPDTALITKDFGKDEAALTVMLKQPPQEGLPYLTALGQYQQAFDTEEVTELFGNFVKSPNTRDLGIMASTMNYSSFDKKKKIIAADARFAYGLVHLFFRNEGGNRALGDKLIKEAAKKNQYGARFVEGMRWAHGYGRDINLKNAVSWMRPAYELSSKRDGDLAQIIEDEFFQLVLDPNYQNRQLYVDLMQAAEEQRQSLQQQIAQNSKNVSNATLFRAQVYNLTITRAQLLIELAEITNAGVDIEKYKTVLAMLSNQADPSIVTVSELIVITDTFQNTLEAELKNVKNMEATAMPKIQALFSRTENYVGDAYAVGVAYGLTSLMSGTMELLNKDALKLAVEIGVMRTKACGVRQGIIDFSSRTNVELQATNVPVNNNILAPRKKKSR